ncbi:amino acid adenylation domain-containing protein [Coleofasciculus sp.]|uniref:amino acid adenylation domain-containing protein n=1 Tax=Coleofasciculus sp. TaxID=3100458 RepID=UPI003A48626B
MQQGMLFHSLYEQQSGVYIEQVIGSLREKLNVSALSQSWQRVVERHSILRTSFHWDDSHHLQPLVSKLGKLPLEQQDWRGLSKSEQESRLQAYLQRDRLRGFDLTEAPLMRFALFQWSEAEFKLVWTFHHALLDGRSILIVLQEVFAFYEAFDQNQELQLKEVRPYQDYIDWLQHQSLTQAEEFWRQQLRGFAEPIYLLGAKGSTPQPVSYSTQKIHLSTASTSALNALAKEHQLTLNTLVQGAWALLLNRYSDNDDVVFGATRACRHSGLGSMKSMVGLFINTLPVRVQVNPEQPLIPWLKALRTQWIGLRDYEHTPLVNIQEWSEVPRGESLFENLLVFENYELNAAFKRQGGKWSDREFELLEQPNYPLNLAVYGESELSLKIDYDSRRFDDVTITRMLGHIEMLLEGFTANPQQCLGELPLLTAAERHQLLVEWNNTQAEYPQDKCIHQLFEEQVEKTPDAVAVVFEDQQLTYWQLNQQANQLAHYLKKLGVKPEMLVGICMERSLFMVVGLLGILKAGGAYVPLDPEYPKERLAHLLSDSQMPVLLTQEKLVARLPENKPPIVCCDTDWGAILQESDENLGSDVKSDNLAYVIYTSGTTGQPKGVMIEHGSVLNLAMGLDQTIYAVQEKDQLRVSLNGSLGFDTSVKQIIQLLSGHTLEIISEELRLDGAALLSYLQRRQIDVLDCTPSQLGLLISAGLLESNIAPQYVLVGGEQINPSMWERLSQAKPSHFFNVYGPTECTVDSTVCDISASQLKSVIGRPIANTQVYILNSQRQPVPINVPGELHIGGAGLARGYLNRPELTTEKFIPNPFSNEPGARLYKTGDKVRYLADGNIEFLGRIDNQVKIRGFRIEPGEIEAVLGQHPAVRDSVVIAQSDDIGSNRLVAYVVSCQGHTSAVDDLRRFLKQKLPTYMIPSGFMVLEALPLTPNGKVDRKALPQIDWAKVGKSESFVAPRTPVEELLAGIWAEVLGLGQVGIYDDFFELGGHSLLATQVISRVGELFSLELPIRCLFDFSTVADLSKQIETIRSQDSNLSPAIQIQPISREAELALSFAQQRLWFLNQLDGQNITYNILSGFHLSGTLDEAALEQSIAEIVKRHESLRTSFSVVDGVAVQVIHPQVNIPISGINLQGLSEVEQATEVKRLVQEENQRPFDLAHCPLLRVTLLQLTRESHILLLTMHHIISDGWSMGIFFRELSHFYAAFSGGKFASLPNLPIQYADFAHWQRQWLQGEVLETQLEYWKRQLAGAQPLLDLPTDRPRPPSQTFRGGTKTFELSGTLTQQLKKLGHQSGTTLFMTLLAAFVTLLSRYSHQDDIVVGTPIAGRNHRETESLIGFFVNTLALRVDLSGNPSFRELLRRTRQVTLEAYSHQDLPFEKLVEELQPERNLSYHPLFQVMFVLQNAGSEDWQLPGLTLSPLEIESVTAKFDLTLAIEEKESGLRGVWEYNSDLFDGTTISRMAGHFQMVLAGIVANPEQSMSELPLLTEAERHQLLVEWNDTEADYPKTKCIHELFEEQVEKTPDAVALVCADERLTYRELNAKANQLAHYLQTLGVESETLVGICVERSPLMVIGLLGILKAGGAYVPLEPSYPQERLKFMLKDSATPVLLTQGQLIEKLPLHQVGVVNLEQDWEGITQQSQENPRNELNSDNLAYIIYTSGTTGTPKGICCKHSGVVNLLTDFQERKSLSVGDRCSLWTVISFDVSVYEIFSSLLSGGSLFIVPDSVRLDAKSYAEWLKANQISSTYVPPFMLNEMADWLEQTADKVSWRRLLVGVEPIPEQLLVRIGDQIPNLQIINGYGPSEGTICTTLYSLNTKIVNTKIVRNRNIPIGKPVKNTVAYVLNAHLQPVPIGVPGELHIGGAGLARGYLNRPELTTEKFIPNPFDNPKSKIQNQKLYKTGDLVRYLPDGNIEFIGRLDNQVKIRGFRIELGEIEAVLSQHPDIQEAVVIARENSPGDKRLVSYIIPFEQGVEISELRRFLKQKLPDYMMPSAFVMLEAMPLTPNGKIDRRALPSLDCSLLRPETSFVTPRTPTEIALATIWKDIFCLKQVSIEDNLFQLGGHSLLAILLVFKISDFFKFELSLETIFEKPTIKELADYIDGFQESSQSFIINALPNVQNQNFPLSFNQQRRWYLEQLNTTSFGSNIFVPINITGLLNAEVVKQVIHEIVHRHQALRTRLAFVHEQPTQIISSDLKIDLPIIDLRNLPEEDRIKQAKQYAIQECKKHFNISKLPLLRFKLLCISQQKYILFFTVDHIVFDEWSLRIFFEEFSILYQNFSVNKPSPLPDLLNQYTDFTYWQKNRLRGKYFEELVSYWNKQLNGASMLLEFPEIKTHSLRGSWQEFAIKYSIYKSLENFSKTENSTLFITLLAAFKILLHNYTKKEDILVAIPLSNRIKKEFNNVIGFFNNIQIIRTDLSGNPSFKELVHRVREKVIGAFSHQELPFALADTIQPNWNQTYLSLLQVVFSIKYDDLTPFFIPNLKSSYMEFNIDDCIAKVPLYLTMNVTQEGLFGVIVYQNSLFSPRFIGQMTYDFTILLERIVEDASIRLSNLPDGETNVSKRLM